MFGQWQTSSENINYFSEFNREKEGCEMISNLKTLSKSKGNRHVNLMNDQKRNASSNHLQLSKFLARDNMTAKKKTS